MVVWLIGVGRFGLQVKGGQLPHQVRGVLYLLMPDGTEHRVGSVLKECWDATLSVAPVAAGADPGRAQPVHGPGGDYSLIWRQTRPSRPGQCRPASESYGGATTSWSA